MNRDMTALSRLAIFLENPPLEPSHNSESAIDSISHTTYSTELPRNCISTKTLHKMMPQSRSPMFAIAAVSILLSLCVATTFGFIGTTTSTSRRFDTATTAKDTIPRGNGRSHTNGFRLYDQTDPQQQSPKTLRAEAMSLQEKAEKLRLEIEQNALSANENRNVATISTRTAVTTSKDSESSPAEKESLSPWAIVSTEPKEEGDRDFRLYVDIGREDGTWMDPRWGASGKRIEFSVDVRLLSNRLAASEVSSKMVQDNTAGKSSQVFALETAQFARLRDGFDRMECQGGAYRIDSDRSGRRTLRIMIDVEGTNRADQSYVYGDVSIPTGGLDNLSIKEGVVSVRQVGWHTGWRREESRIAGVFTAKPLPEATKKDGF